jgi:hypothetical protein
MRCCQHISNAAMVATWLHLLLVLLHLHCVRAAFAASAAVNHTMLVQLCGTVSSHALYGGQRCNPVGSRQ